MTIPVVQFGVQGPPGPVAASVVNAAALTATLTATFLAGTQAYVQSLKSTYYYDPTSAATPDNVTVIAAQGGGNWVLVAATSAAAIPPGVTPFVFDPSSIVPGGLDGAAWRMLYPSLAPTIRRFGGTDVHGYTTLVEVNKERTATVGGMLARPFTLPPTCTGVSISLSVLQSANANVVVLRLTDVLGQTVLGTVTITPTSLLAPTSLAVTGLTAGAEYQVQILVNSAGQANFFATRVGVTPTGGTGFWASAWQRLDAARGTILDTNENGWAAVRYPSQSTFSHVDFVTNATTVVVETYNNLGENYVPPYDSSLVLVDGLVYATIDPAIDGVAYTTVNLPGAAHRVSVVASAQIYGGQSPDEVSATPGGTFTCGVYVPAQSVLIAPGLQPTRDTWVVYGDSKSCAYSQVAQGQVGALRSQNLRAVCEAYGGRNMAYDLGGGAVSVANCTAFALKLCLNNPNVVLINIGRNDFFGAGYTLANFTTTLGNLVTAIHNVNPDALVKLATFSRETSEPNNSNGDTMDSWRLAMTTVAGNNPTFCTLLAWDQAWTVANAATYTVDGVHPNDRGQALLSSITMGDVPGITGFTGMSPQNGEPWPWSPLAIGATLKAWFDVTQVQSLTPGASMSAVTAVGGGPTVTLTGTPLFAFNLLIAFNLGGGLNTATFKWSIDGGRSWVQSNVVTSASVALPGTGVTVLFSFGSYANTMTYAASTLVASIADLSGTGNTIVQAVGANQMPLGWLALSKKNQVPCLVGNGTSTFYAGTGIALTAPFSMWGVFLFTSMASTQVFMGSNGGADLLYNASGTTVGIYAGTGVVGGVTDMTKLHCYVATFSSSGAIYVDSNTALASGNAGTTTMTNLYIGQQGGAVDYVAGSWVEAGFVSGGMSQVQINQLNAYLAAKYNTGIAPL